MVSFDMDGAGPDWMDLSMKWTEVDGRRKDFLEPGGWIWKFAAVMAACMAVVHLWQCEEDLREIEIRSLI